MLKVPAHGMAATRCDSDITGLCEVQPAGRCAQEVTQSLCSLIEDHGRSFGYSSRTLVNVQLLWDDEPKMCRFTRPRAGSSAPVLWYSQLRAAYCAAAAECHTETIFEIWTRAIDDDSLIVRLR